MINTLRLSLLLFTVLMLSCEKTIEFKPGNQEAKLVVDGTIETGKRPVVYLTTSMNFFSNISIGQLDGLFVNGALITLSNGSETNVLREYREDAGAGLSIYYYTSDTSALADSFVGEQGKTYTLHMNVGDREYTATTVIPVLRKTINALYFDDHVDEQDSTKVVLYGLFSDPEGYGNYTRYFTRTNSYPFYPGLNSVSDDQVTDGKKYKMQIENGVDRNKPIDYENYSFFHKGDTVSVKFCNIDKGVFDFWRTMEYSYSSIGNPFSSPTKVQGNISNGALGYFGGYSVQYLNILIPE